MASSSIISAALGIVFWTVAAKLYPPEQLGVMTAVLSVITAVSTMAAASAGDAYQSLLPAAGPARWRVYSRGQRVWLCAALAGGVGGGLATVLSLPQVHKSISVAALVAFGIVAWSAFSLQSSTLTSLGRAKWLPAAILVNSVGKVLLLLVLAYTLVDHSVELAFIIPAAIIVLLLRPVIVRVVKSGRDLPTTATVPEAQVLGEFNKLSMQMVSLSILSMGSVMLTPFLVTKFAGPADGALFALCLTIVQTLDFIGAAMGVSLVVHASSAPEHGASMARSILTKTTLVVAAGAVLFVAVVPVGLRFLQPQYGELGPVGVIAMLSVGAVVHVPYIVWAGLQRARRQMRAPLLCNFVAAILLFALLPALSSRYGGSGGALALLIPQVFLACAAGIHYLVHRRDPN